MKFILILLMLSASMQGAENQQVIYWKLEESGAYKNKVKTFKIDESQAYHLAKKATQAHDNRTIIKEPIVIVGDYYSFAFPTKMVLLVF